MSIFFCWFSFMFSCLCNWSYLTVDRLLYLKNNLRVIELWDDRIFLWRPFLFAPRALPVRDLLSLSSRIEAPWTIQLMQTWVANPSKSWFPLGFPFPWGHRPWTQFNIYEDNRLLTMGGPKLSLFPTCFVRPPRQHFSFACFFRFGKCYWGQSRFVYSTYLPGILSSILL